MAREALKDATNGANLHASSFKNSGSGGGSGAELEEEILLSYGEEAFEKMTALYHSLVQDGVMNSAETKVSGAELCEIVQLFYKLAECIRSEMLAAYDLLEQ